MDELLEQRHIGKLLSKYLSYLHYIQTLLKDLEGSSSKSTRSLSRAYNIECSAPSVFYGNYLTKLSRKQLRNCCNGTEEGLNIASSTEPRTSPLFDGSSLDVSKAPFIYNNVPSECFEVMAARTTTTATQSASTRTTATIRSRHTSIENETTVNLLRHKDDVWLTAVLIFLIVLSVFLTVIILYRCRSLWQELKKNKNEKRDPLCHHK